MSLKLRLIAMNFLQYFVWGAWLITIGAYWFQTRHWSATQFGAIFSTMGIASLFMPSITGVIADDQRSGPAVLGDAPEHDVLHADHLAGDYGGVQHT